MSYQHQYIDGTPIHFPLGKLVCVGRNYAEHAKELNNPVPTEPLLFIKPGSCVVPVSREEVLDAISGYAPALDLTLREVQAKLKEKGLPWELAKSFDGAGVLSPFVNADQFPDPTDIGIRLTINGEVRQDGNSRDMLNPIVPLIQHIAGHFSLQAGDVVLTGTPSGVGPLNSGDPSAGSGSDCRSAGRRFD